MGTSFTSLRLFFHKVSIISVFSPLREMLYAGRVKLYAEASELFTHAVFQLAVVLQTGILGVHPSADKKMEVGRC